MIGTIISKRLATVLFLSGLSAASAGAQSTLAQQSTAQQSTRTSTAKPAPKPAATPVKKISPKPVIPLVYVSTSSKASNASVSQKPQNAEVMKAFQQNCPSVALTQDKAKARYQVTFEQEPGSKGVKTAFGLTNAVYKTNRLEVTSKNGQTVFSETEHSTSQLVKDACSAIAAPAAARIDK